MSLLKEIEASLGLTFEPVVGRTVEKVLCLPLEDLASRPKKNFRARLVHLGFKLGGWETEGAALEQQAADLVEAVHAGSLVIDDIQDGSEQRRGRPTLHREYGVPIAINTGNWLYFWALESVRKMKLSPQQEADVLGLYRQTLLKAHLGQALDIGTDLLSLVDDEIPSLCLRSISLKSGALVAFAVSLGAVIYDGPAAAYQDFGNRFGTALQMFDDLGNALGRKDPGKRFEDLVLKRPSWVWAVIFSESSQSERDEFRALMTGTPEVSQIKEWVESRSSVFEEAHHRAKTYLENSFRDFKKAAPLCDAPLKELIRVGEELVKAYE